MQIGWIDFSKKDREKVLSVLQLLNVKDRALDELGIGTIRDGFADYFFPGISTIQTRAKYFLIVPYVLKEAGEGKYGHNLDQVIRAIDDQERKCGIKLLEGDTVGVIGVNSLPDRWVVRKPSEIYWSGIKRLGIFKESGFSINEYLRTSLQLVENNRGKSLGNRPKDGEENAQDDKDAGDFNYKSFWNLPTYKENWISDLTIELLPDEAEFLKRQVEDNLQGSLFAYVLENHINVNAFNDFASISAAVRDGVSEELRRMMELANEFNNLVYLARIRYNVILSVGKNKVANDEWDIYCNNLDQYAQVNLNEVYERLNIRDMRLKKFLENLQRAFFDNDIEDADRLIEKREISLKGDSRAKLLNSGEEWADTWIGGEKLDYRFNASSRIINDIFKGGGRIDV